MFKYHLFILGCQFNYYDAEKLAAALDRIGGLEVMNVKDADLSVVFACSVRQKAADRILGHIRNWKKQNKSLKVLITACVLPLDNKKLSLKSDSVISERELIDNPSTALERIGISIADSTDLSPQRRSNYQLYNKMTAYVTITAGCNNYCTYCAVPYARGRETSKPVPIVLSKVDKLARSGINHIILLGQNVNSYGLSDYHPRNMRKNKSSTGLKWSKKRPSPFVELLRSVETIQGIEKITFLSPNPQDMSADLIDWMKTSPKFSKDLNLPMQSGSTRILKKMNRRYTRTEYLSLVRDIRKAVPDIHLSTDIIVGFPNESIRDFELSLSAAKICKFNKAFISIYSPRPGTVSARMDNDVPFQEKKRRWLAVNQLINK